MAFDRYAGEAAGHVEELIEEIEALGRDVASDAVRTIGTEGWRQVLTLNGHLMFEYIEAAPSRRRRLHRDLAPADRALFLLGCVFYSRCGAALLEQISRQSLAPGYSYRRMTRLAAEAAQGFVAAFPRAWPFDDDDDPLGKR